MSRISGTLILITGASSGIGAACARRFAAEGAHLILWARRRDRLDALAAELAKAHNVKVRVDQVDVRDRGSVEKAAQAALAASPAPDVLINNAGLASGLSLVQDGSLEDWDRMIDTNVKGLLFVTRAVLPAMIARGRGHVVNIGSTAGHQVYQKGNVYNATKFAVKALTEGINLDVAGTPLRVSSVDPGFVETEFSLVRFHGDEAKARTTYQGFRALTGDDVADTISYVINLPDHVNILDLIVVPAAQRSVHLVDKK